MRYTKVTIINVANPLFRFNFLDSLLFTGCLWVLGVTSSMRCSWLRITRAIFQYTYTIVIKATPYVPETTEIAKAKFNPYLDQSSTLHVPI